MIAFWLCAGFLCLAAFGCLSLPLWRGGRELPETDRAGLNVSLYQARLLELQQQHEAQVLTDEQHQAARDEAARELLADTEPDPGRHRTGTRRGSRTVLLATAVLAPALALLLYAHWGAIGDVEQARDRTRALATDTSRRALDLDAITARLEQAVRDRPESSEGWYFLGRTYLAEGRATDAANALERAIATGERQPTLLGLRAQALYLANDKQWTAQLDALTREALTADPAEPFSLGLLGSAAFDQQRYADAIGYWQQLAAAMPADDPARQSILRSIGMARQRLGASADDPTAAEAPSATLKIRVDIAPALRDKVRPDDAVFVFARAAAGPPMPLAVKRLRVADLPAAVSLSDADAMMPALKLSAFDRIQLVARISREGDARKGEWVGRTPPFLTSNSGVRQLIIDEIDVNEPPASIGR